MILKKTFLSWWIMPFLKKKKTWKMWGNKEILNLSQQKEEETIWCPNQIIILKFFIDTLLAIEVGKKIVMNKPVYLGLPILELSKILMHEFWYDYVKPKHGEKGKLCYMNTDSFIAYIKNRWNL